MPIEVVIIKRRITVWNMPDGLMTSGIDLSAAALMQNIRNHPLGIAEFHFEYLSRYQRGSWAACHQMLSDGFFQHIMPE